MKLFAGGLLRRSVEEIAPDRAVQLVADKAATSYEGREEQLTARAEALQGILGRLLGALIDNGCLRKDQVSAIFDYDVIAED